MSGNKERLLRKIEDHYGLLQFYAKEVGRLLDRIDIASIIETATDSEDIRELNCYLDELYRNLLRAIKACDIPEMNGLVGKLELCLDQSNAVFVALGVLKIYSDFVEIIEGLYVETIREIIAKLGIRQ